MPGAGRLGDKGQNPSDAHGCPGCPHPTVGPAVAGSPDVNVNGRPALRVQDQGMHAACCGPNTWVASAGSSTVFINGKAAHRLQDAQRHCGGVGKLIEGSADVLIGDATSGGAGGTPGGASSSSDGASAAKSGSGASDGTAGSDSAEGSGAEAAGGAAAPASDAPPSKAEPEPRDAWIEVEVLDEDGKPLAGADYKLELPDGSIVKGKLDDRGAVRKEQLQAGTGRIFLADDDDYEAARALASPPPVEPALAWIEVLVLDAAGQPAEGLPYRLVLPDGTEAKGTIDATGRIRKDQLPDGNCTLLLPDDEADVEPRALVAAAAASKQTGFIEVVVRDDEGRPAADLPYRLELPDGKVLEGKLDTSGRIRKDDVPLGDCRLYLPDDAGESVSGPERAARAAVAKPLLGFIELALRDEDGRPVGGAAYCLTLPDGAERKGTLDPNGRARLNDVPVGGCTLKWSELDADAIELCA